jgi:hypothetical protein
MSWALRLMQGVHTEVVEKLCKVNARSALELCFEFIEECARWAYQNNLKMHKRGIVQGMHTIVVEKLYEASVRSALELNFDFTKEHARWAYHNRIKAQKGKLS